MCCSVIDHNRAFVFVLDSGKIQMELKDVAE